MDVVFIRIDTVDRYVRIMLFDSSNNGTQIRPHDLFQHLSAIFGDEHDVISCVIEAMSLF